MTGNNKQQEEDQILRNAGKNPGMPACFRAGKYSLPIGGKTLVMGILNLTPDSFYPGSRFSAADIAFAQAEKMLQQGADIIDIGGESTRPGGAPLSLADELERVVPVIEHISSRISCPVSIDTYKPEVAIAALDAGACIINDVKGLQGDPKMPAAAASRDAGIIIMHNARLYRDETAAGRLSAVGQAGEDIIQSMLEFIRHSLDIALQAGISRERIALDPGIGFGVTPEESIRMLTELREMRIFGLPVLIGPSRKRFIGDILNKPVEERLHGTSAAVALGIANGADIIRVHDVAAQADVARVADAICGKVDGGWR